MHDIHSHIVFDVDDGACNIDESLRMLWEAQTVGIRSLIATPHYQEDLFDIDRVLENFNKLKSGAANFDVELKLGAEVFLEPTLPEKLEINKMLALNGSKYILFDTPFGSVPKCTGEVLDRLIIKGYKPILAHPERNRYYINHYHVLNEFYERGCMIQIDAGSIAGIYGWSTRNLAKRIIKENMAQFVASNAHCPTDYEWMTKARNTLLKWIGEECTYNLLRVNAEQIEREELEVTA